MKQIFFCCLLFMMFIGRTQNLNTIMFDDSLKKQVYVGLCSIDEVKTGLWVDIFDKTYLDYKIHEEFVNQLKGKLDDISFRIVFASWCGDSKEQLPAFIKILNELKYPVQRIELIAVNRVFNAVLYDISGLSIRKVPTFIVYKQGQEIGRIIEIPETTLEEDLLKIITQK